MGSHVWLDYVAAGEGYAAENFMLAAAGMINQMQLFNPAGSGRRVRMRSGHMIGGAASSATIRRHDTPLATATLPVPFIIENLLGGGLPGLAEMRSDVVVAASGALFWSVNAAGSSPAPYPPQGREWGFDLLPGQGMLFAGPIGGTLIVNWHWAEVREG